MRFFKHGDCLAIVIPEPLRQANAVKENDDYEFFELEKGMFVLVAKTVLAEKTKKSALHAMQAPSFQAAALSASSSPQHATPIPQKTPSSPQPVKRLEPVYGTPEWKVAKNGFAIMEYEGDAKRVSAYFEEEIKNETVLGTRGFDKKFYVATKQSYDEVSRKISKAFGTKAFLPSDAAAAVKEDENKTACVVQIMREKGDAIEKKRGLFQVVQ